MFSASGTLYFRVLIGLRNYVSVFAENFEVYGYPSGSGRLSSFLELKQVSEVLT
jgi:hypothetical protein